jgi:hypothetical protein
MTMHLWVALATIPGSRLWHSNEKSLPNLAGITHVRREICGLADRRNNVHFNQVAVAQDGDRDNSGGRFMGTEVILIYCIDLAPQSDVRDLHGRLEHPFMTATTGLQNCIDIFRNLQSLRFNAFEFPIRMARDNGKLPGKKPQIVVHNGLRELAHRSRAALVKAVLISAMAICPGPHYRP